MGAGAKLEAIQSELPDTGAYFARHFARWPSQLAACLIFGLLIRVAAFGDPAVHIDEAWYFLVGQWMHRGAIPYVDVWDRKPFLLFGLYYLFAGISDSVLAYQIPAWISASLTAFVIIRLALRWTGIQGAVLAGLCYLALLDQFEGIGGQAPVFYNLLIASAGLLLVQSFDRLRQDEVPRRVLAAMALCGLAIMVKQTALFESVFFGVWAVVLLWRSGKPLPWVRIAAMALLGAAPTLAVAAYYWISGHWFEFWQAMVVSNVAKQSATPFQYFQRSVNLLFKLWLLAAVAILAFRSGLRGNSYRPFLLGWVLVSLFSFISVPNLYYHYCLPLMVPLALVIAVELNRRGLGAILAIMLVAYATLLSGAFNFPRHWRSERDMHHLASVISAHAPRGTLLVFDAQPLLYTISGTRPLTALSFPNHLNHEIERNVSHLDTRAEMLRVLRARPGAVAVAEVPRVRLPNRENWMLLLAYTRGHCKLVGSSGTAKSKPKERILIYGDCD